VLAAVVKGDLGRFSAAAKDMIGLHSSYVSTLLGEVKEGIDQSKEVSWVSVLELCEWAVEQRDEEGEAQDAFDLYDNWSDTRRQIARLIGTSLRQNALPLELHERIWDLIRILSSDDDPSSDTEHEGMSPWDLAINSVRGEALHSAVQYGLWLLRQNQNLEGQGFSRFPELRELFDDHLVSDIERSLAVHSVYGQFFPWLQLMDDQWASENADRIFPQEESGMGHWTAAWGAYILFCQPFAEVLRIIGRKYIAALDRLSEEEFFKNEPRVLEQLSHHIMTYCWRGDLQRLGLESLLDQFWSNAPEEVRDAAISFVGRVMTNSDVSIPPDVAERLQRMFDQRLADCEQHGAHACRELGSFGWWFSAGQLDDYWLMNTLVRVVNVTNHIENERDIITRLVNVCEEWPEESANAIHVLVRGETNRWFARLAREPLLELLRRLRDMENESIRAEAMECANLLVARGHLEFRAIADELSSGTTRTQ